MPSPPPPPMPATRPSPTKAPTEATPTPMTKPTTTITPSSNNSASDPSGARPVVVPRCSAWFALDRINPIERRMLPEFFSVTTTTSATSATSSKTPALYLKYRNYMVHASRQQPHVYLTATACRRNLAGDACAILRVHEFLTHWGLINYHVPPHALPPAMLTATTTANYALRPHTAPAASPTTRAGLAPPTAAAGSSHHQPSTADVVTRRCELCGLGAVAFELTPEAKRKAGVAPAQGTTPTTTPALGAAAGGAPLVLGALGTRPGAGLCDDCVLARAFPEGLDAGDFVRVPGPVTWSPDEDARLLAAVSASAMASTTTAAVQNEACDWNQIAAKVQTKSADECIVRFLEMPIVRGERGERDRDDSLAPAFAYAESVNAPVREMAALVRDVDPVVAKAAARAAIRAVRDLHTLKSSTSHESLKKEIPTVEPVGNGDASKEVEAAAKEVSASAAAAGIAPIKLEPTLSTSTTTTAAKTDPTTGDVEMADANEEPVSCPSVTKETLAVVQEASTATAVALMATRADAVATATARGPIRDLMTQLLTNQLEQMELKMQQLSTLEKAIAVEKETLTKERHQLYMERLAFAQLKLGGGA